MDAKAHAELYNYLQYRNQSLLIAEGQRRARAVVVQIVGFQDAEDVLQDAALLAWHNRKQFRGDAAYATWFTTIAIHCALMHIKNDETPDKVFALAQESPDGASVLLFFQCPGCGEDYHTEIPSQGGGWIDNRYFYRCNRVGV